MRGTGKGGGGGKALLGPTYYTWGAGHHSWKLSSLDSVSIKRKSSLKGLSLVCKWPKSVKKAPMGPIYKLSFLGSVFI